VIQPEGSFRLDTFTGFLAADIVTLFVVVYPLGVMPFYQGLTAAATDSQKKVIVNKAILAVLVILAFFAVIGDAVLGFLGITLHYIMIAGGLYILIFAVKSALGGEEQTTEANSTGRKPKGLPEAMARRIAVVPLATPLLAGPGSIATVMILNDGPGGVTATLLAIICNAVLAWLILRTSDRLARHIGPSNLMILNVMMNILMAAIGVAFILKGTFAAFHLVIG